MSNNEIEILAICDYLKKRYSVQSGAGYFFDLSHDFVVIHLLAASDEMIPLVGHSRAFDIPYAIMEYFEEVPTFFVHTNTLYKEENLKTCSVIRYRKYTRQKISFEEVTRELHLLKSELLKSQAS